MSGSGVNKAIGIVFLIIVIAVMVPVAFGGSGLGNATLFENAPTWLLPLLALGAGITLVKLLIPSK